MKKTIVAILIAVVMIPQVSFGAQQLSTEQRVLIQNIIEVLMKRIVELQDQLIALKQAELDQKKEEFESLQTKIKTEDMAKEKTSYKVISPEGGKIEVNRTMTVEEMRDFIISLNRDHIKFRQRMEVAPANELVDFLKANGYTVK